MLRWARILGVAAIATAAAAAKPLNSPGQDGPTFRSAVQSIEVDVRVTDTNGRPVSNLAKGDFMVLEDGVPQTISTATFVDLGIESPVRPIPRAVETDVVNNANAGSGRMWVMLLGGFGERARLVARRFVEDSLGPNDEAAVIPVYGTMSSAQGFTRSRHLLLDALDRLQSDSPDEFMGDSARTAYRVLEELCLYLGRVGGRRKSVLFFDPPKFFSPAEAKDLSLVPLFFDQRDAIRAATRNNVAVYVVATEGMTTELGGLKGIAGQRLLAEETGGDAIINSNNFDDGFRRFVQSANQYYLLGYTPSVEHRDGEFHSITVRVNRPGLTVHARWGYYAPQPDPEPPSEPAAAPDPDMPGLSPDALAALRLPLSMNGLTLELAAAPFRGATGRPSVLLTARVRGTDLVLGRGERMEVGYRATTPDGKTTPGVFHVFKLDLSEASRASANAMGLRFVDWLALLPGRHQVRFVAHQPNGRTGMVVADVEVPDFNKAPVSLSGVVLASERLPSQLAMKTDEALQKRLRGHPTAERSFSRNDRITAYAEVYTSAQSMPQLATATVAPADELTRTRIVETTISAVEPGRLGQLASLPLRDLRPGDYVLTLEARAGRQTATRQVLFSVTER